MTEDYEPKEIQVFQPATMETSAAVVREKLELLNTVAEVIQATLVKGVDYMTLPTGGKRHTKPFLTKSGGEKLMSVYGYRPHFKTIKSIDKPGDPMTGKLPHWEFEVECTLIRVDDDKVVGHGRGSASSNEDKYLWVWRGMKDLPPEHRKLAEAKEYDKIPYIMRDKYGLQFRVPNPGIWGLRNTILKMADKRALMSPVLAATRLSAGFTLEADELEARHVVSDGITDEQYKRLRDWSDLFPAVKAELKGKRRGDITEAKYYEVFDMVQEFKDKANDRKINKGEQVILKDILKKFPELESELSVKTLSRIPLSEYDDLKDKAEILEEEQS